MKPKLFEWVVSLIFLFNSFQLLAQQTLTIVSSVASTSCQGSLVTFTANAGCKGTGIVKYEWLVNNIVKYSDNNISQVSTWDTTHLLSGDVVSCRVYWTDSLGGICGGISPLVSNNITMTVNPNPTPSINGLGDVCSGDTNSYSTVNIPGHSYSWSVNGGGNIIGVQDSNFVKVTFSSAGTGSQLILTETDTLTGCNSTTQITIIVHPKPNVFNVTGSGSYCQGDSFTIGLDGSQVDSIRYELFRDGSSTGIIITGNGNPLNFINQTQQGTYTILAIDTATNCSAYMAGSAIVIIHSSPPKPSISPQGPLTFCSGGNVILNSTSSASYIWSTNATTSSITISTSGTYTVTVFNSFGCTSAPSDSVTVTVLPVPATPIITANGSLIFCLGDSVKLTSSAGSNNHWSSGDTTKSIVVHTSGTYTDTVRGSNGCFSISLPVSVTVNPLPPTPLITPSGTITICTGDSILLSTSTPVPSPGYLWNNGATTAGITVHLAGTYTVTVTDTNGCTSSQSKIVTVIALPPKPTFTNLPVPDTVCANSAHFSFNADSINGVSFVWNSSTAGVIIYGNSLQNAVITFPSTGSSYTAYINVIAIGSSGSAGCRDTNKLEIFVNESSHAPDTAVIVLKQPGYTLIYLDNSVTSYQWGYDDSATRYPHKLTGEVFQSYSAKNISVFDTIHKYFWVEVGNGQGCYSKIYYNGPYATGRVVKNDPLQPFNAVISPNPNSGNLAIELSGEIYGEIDIQLYDITGRRASTSVVNKTMVEQTFVINHQLAKGFYSMIVKGLKGEQKIKSFLVQ